MIFIMGLYSLKQKKFEYEFFKRLKIKIGNDGIFYFGYSY